MYNEEVNQIGDAVLAGRTKQIPGHGRKYFNGGNYRKLLQERKRREQATEARATSLHGSVRVIMRNGVLLDKPEVIDNRKEISVT